MITIEQAKEFCEKTNVTDVEMVSVIKLYLFEKTGMDKEINIPTDMIGIQLMSYGFNACCKYYLQ